jgi:hypothetical protein
VKDESKRCAPSTPFCMRARYAMRLARSGEDPDDTRLQRRTSIRPHQHQAALAPACANAGRCSLTEKPARDSGARERHARQPHRQDHRQKPRDQSFGNGTPVTGVAGIWALLAFLAKASGRPSNWIIPSQSPMCRAQNASKVFNVRHGQNAAVQAEGRDLHDPCTPRDLIG